MRKIVGLLIFSLGLVLLGLWANSDHAIRIEAKVANAALDALGDTVHNVELKVSGRDIELSGFAASEAEQANIVGQMQGVRGQRIVRSELQVVPTISPYKISLSKKDNTYRYSGLMPFADAYSELPDGDRTELKLAGGVPDENWLAVFSIGVQFLEGLANGEVSLIDQTLRLEGHAPDIETAELIEAGLRTLPDGYRMQKAITIEPTIPYLFSGANVNGVLEYSGYLPSNTRREEFKEKLGETITSVLIPKHGMPDENWIDVVSLSDQVLQLVTSGKATLSDRSVLLMGTAANPVAKAKIDRLIAQIPGNYDTVVAIEVAKVVPYRFSAKKSDTGILSASGFAPDQETLDEFMSAAQNFDANIELGAGMPDVSWPYLVTQSLKAIQDLQAGEISIEDQSMKISGQVANPIASSKVKGFFEQLPEGYFTDFQLVELDDGDPILLLLEYEQDGVTRISGKAPSGFDVDQIATLLSVPQLVGSIQASTLPGLEPLSAQFDILGRWLPSLESVQVDLSLEQVTIEGTILPEQDLEQITSALLRELGSSAIVKLQTSEFEPKEGDRKLAPVSGQGLVYRNGFWIPYFEFEGTVDNCSDRTAKAVEGKRITFLSGSAELDPNSISIINELAGVFANCIGEDGLSLEIGGHTDSLGDDNANQALSLARAVAVVKALVDRGVSDKSVSAIGYGESQPIADNETEEGRAANRRTTFIFSQN